MLQSHAGRRGNGKLEKERGVILNKVTFEQSPGGDEGYCAGVLGKCSSDRGNSRYRNPGLDPFV